MPDDYLTVDEVAAQLALPLEMIQRRIESGDIPVHWVEVGGKLEMRISASEIGVEEGGAAPTPFPAPEGFAETAEDDQEVAPSSWSVREPDYSPDVWAPAEGTAPEAPVPTPTWAGEPSEEAPAAAASSAPEAETPAEPVWSSDPATWEDEPLDGAPAPAAPPELSPFSAPGTDAYFPLEEATAETEPAAEEAEADEEEDALEAVVAEEVEVELPSAAEAVVSPFASAAQSLDVEEGSAFELAEEEEIAAASETLGYEPELAGMGSPDLLDVPRPSALAMAQSGDSSLALNSIDARELVSGLFERWERALEQRIQAEQRLRFEAELERRLRQVRDLRQELENTRKSTAAQLAEREQEVMALRNRLRDQGNQGKSRGLFRR